MTTHNAETYGTNILNNIIGKRFDYPKSLYAVHDVLRFFVANKPNALILDFFAGSGTTLHAVNLLNKEDGGNRRCIMVTNNEIGETKEKENDKYIRRERYSGSMQRSFYVGDAVTEDDIKAAFKHGVLSLSIPKKKQEIPQKSRILIEG